MSIGRDILKEANKVEEDFEEVSYKGKRGKAGQITASFEATNEQRETVYHNVIDWCNSMEELKEYTGKALQDLIDFIDTTDYYIESALVLVMGLSSIESNSYSNYKVIGRWYIYRDGEYTDELEFAKGALGYDTDR